MSDSDSRCYLGLHEVFVALETKRLCKFVSLVMVWPGEQYISGAFQAQSSSAYSSSTDEGWIPRNTVYWAGSGAFFQVCRAEGATCSWCAPDGSRESVKCQVRQEACAPRWSNQLHDITAEVATSKNIYAVSNEPLEQCENWQRTERSGCVLEVCSIPQINWRERI